MGGITPCLWFDTQAEEAAAFYVSVFKNSRILSTSYFGEGGLRPADLALTVEFEIDGQPLTALNGGPEFSFNEAVSFQISCTGQAEVDYYWDTLTADGGEPGQCGWLKDRYGVSWQVVPTELTELLTDPDPGRTARAVQKMLTMSKLDIAAMQAAADEA